MTGAGSAVTGGPRARLLERERELAELESAFDRALSGHGGTVVIEGPAGIGKSELLRAAVDRGRARGARPLTARGLELERELAFGAVRQLLEPVLQAATAEEAERLFTGAATPARRLFDARPERAAGTALDSEFAILNALYWMIAGLADIDPLVLVIDDAHWLDLPSLRLLDFLAPRIEELSALALVSTRPRREEHAAAVLGRLLADPNSRVIRPGPLSAPAVAELLRERLGADPDPEFAAACAEGTAGNPFYLDELLRELELRDARPTAQAAAEVKAMGPRAISLSLRHRGGPGAEGLALARALSVLGETHDFGLLTALAGLDRSEAARAVDAMVRDSILTPGPPLAFAHPIVRSAVYSELGPRDQADLHARAAQLLQATGAPSERVAAHLMRSDPSRDAAVVKVLRAAATAASSQGAPASVIAYLRRALAESPDDAERAAVLLELARAETSALDPQAATHFAQAYELTPDVRTRAEVTLAAAPVLFVSGHSDDAVAMASAIHEQLAHDDPDLALKLDVDLASLAMFDLGVNRDALRFARHAENLAGDSPVARQALCHAAFGRTWRSEDAAHAVALAERGLANGLLLAERGTETPELASAGLTLIYADRLEAARELVDAALAQARRRGARFGFAHVSGLAAELSYRAGSLADVEADARTCLAMTAPAGNTAGVAVGTAILVKTLIERGQLSEAEHVLSENGLLADAELPPQLAFNWVLSARGRLRLASGDSAGGIRDLRECGHRNRGFGVRNPLTCPWRPELALAHQARGELDAAHALAEEELAAARDWATPGVIGAAKRLLGLLSSGEEAVALLREGAAALGESPARLEHARALVDLGAALRRANQRAEAREPLSSALDLADRCGATVLSRRARDELAATGARPRRARLTGLEALTASERRVAELAARGLGNTEIAQSLFVTRKTVEKHLGNTYAKLGVKSRKDLPALFAVTPDGHADHDAGDG